MATPRSESIKKARSGSSEIRPSTEDSIVENKIDHLAVLSQVVDQGVLNYYKTIPEDSKLDTTNSLYQLSNILRNEVSDTLIQTLTSEPFTDHFRNLHASQVNRHEVGASRWDDVMLSIVAGTTTFVHTFTHVFMMMQRHYSIESATHPGSWRVADRLAKLDLEQLSAYYNTYISNFGNWPDFMKHLSESEDGYVQFLPGYPEDALVTVPASKLTNPFDFYDDPDLAPIEVLVEAQLKDMDISQKIGCPVTFSPEVIKTLWELYTYHAHRIATTPAIGGSEASRQQTVEQSQRLYRQLAQSIPSARSEHPILQSGH